MIRYVADLLRCARRDIARMRWGRAMPSGPSMILRQRGYAILESLVAPDTCDHIAAHVRRLVENHPNSAKLSSGAFLEYRAQGTSGWDSGMVDIHDFHLEMPEVLAILQSPAVEETITGAMGPLKLLRVHAYYNRGIRQTRGLHVDSFAIPLAKSLLYLTDVTAPEDGPYCYVAGSHRPNLAKYQTLLANIISRPEIRTNISSKRIGAVTEILGKRGDMIISDQSGFHRGHPQGSEKERIVLVGGFSRQELEDEPVRRAPVRREQET